MGFIDLLRYEQKTEDHRLDVLKRAFQAKLYGDRKQAEEVLAA
jgi:hypothetical protein